MSASPSLSVVIPCLDEADHLAEQLEGLAQQEWDGTWEVLLADNGSTDDSTAIARTFEGRLPSLRIVDASALRGRQYACNAAARLASHDALVFVDGDDVVAPGYLAAMAAALHEHRFVAARLDHEKLNPAWLREARRGAQSDGLQDWHHLPMAAGGSLGVDRATFFEVGGFDEGMHYAEDVDLCWRLQRLGHELQFVPEAVLHYRYREAARDLYIQARGYGRGAAVLYRLFDSPAVTPQSKAKGGVALLARLVKRLPRLRNRTVRANAVWDTGYFVGWTQGSLRPSRYCQPTKTMRR